MQWRHTERAGRSMKLLRYSEIVLCCWQTRMKTVNSEIQEAFRCLVSRQKYSFSSKVEYNHVTMNFPNFSFQDIFFSHPCHDVLLRSRLLQQLPWGKGCWTTRSSIPPGKEPGMTEVRDAVMRRWLTSDILDAGKADLGHEASGAPAHKSAQLNGS